MNYRLWNIHALYDLDGQRMLIKRIGWGNWKFQKTDVYMSESELMNRKLQKSRDNSVDADGIAGGRQ